VSLQDVQAELAVRWEARSAKMDWIPLERCLREVLRAARAGECSPAQALTLMDEVLASFTGRGHELPDGCVGVVA
jgi:hypothetical protein